MNSKKIASVLFFTLYSLVIAFVLAEAAARILHLAPPLPRKSDAYMVKPHLRYHYKPNITAKAVTPEYKVIYQYNDQGLRDHPRPIAKPAGTFRILGLGDSFTEGMGVQYHQMYLFLLEQAINRIGQHPFQTDVVKAGIAGYDPKHERLYLEHYGVDYQPDVVILAYSGTDSLEAALGVHYTISKQGYLLKDTGYSLNPVFLELYIHSHFARTILRKIIDRERGRFNAARNTAEEQAAIWREGWTKTFVEYDQVKRICDRIGAELVVMYIPFKITGDQEEKDRAVELAGWCGRNQVRFVNLLPYFAQHPQVKELHYPMDGHCTPLGNQLIAQVLYQHLKKWDLIKI